MGDPIPLIYFPITVTDPKKLKEAEGVDTILAAAREVNAQLGIDPEEHEPVTNFWKLPAYEKEPLMAEAIDEGFGLSVMSSVPCAAKGLATSIIGRN